MHRYKLYHHFAIWSVFFLLILNVTAGKTIDVLGIPTSIGILLFPIIYIMADVLTEVYGYAAARKVVWYTALAGIFSTLYFQFVAWYPPSDTFAHNEAYTLVLKTVPQITIAGIIAVFCGDITNNYIVAKMKVWFKGRRLALRLVVSTLAGQFVNTLIFFVFGLWGILPFDSMVISIVFGTAVKTGIEILMLPVTIRVIRFLKAYEGVDVYDAKTNFTPFRI